LKNKPPQSRFGLEQIITPVQKENDENEDYYVEDPFDPEAAKQNLESFYAKAYSKYNEQEFVPNKPFEFKPVPVI